jgi:predicted secreted Zn-dependent protease
LIRTASLLLLACLSACQSTPRLDLGPRPAGVTVDAQLRYYDVNAATLAEIRRAMAQSGPRAQGRVWGAVTTWRFSWTYEYDNRGVNCSLRNVRVRMQTTIDFPRWNPTAEPDSAGLAEHERGHARIAMDTAGEIVKALDGMMGGRCQTLGEQANMVSRRLVEAGNRRQAEYDASTRHGALQIQQARRLRQP